MRFCLITTFYPPYSFGGDAVFVQRLGGLLAQRGHELAGQEAWRTRWSEEAHLSRYFALIEEIRARRQKAAA